MNIFHHHVHLHLPHCVQALKKDTNSIYTVHAIRGFVFSLFGIFIPIYLLTLDFTLVQVLLFYLVKRSTLLAITFFTGPIANRFGLKHTMLMSLPIALVYLISLSLLEIFTFPILLYSLALFSGFQAALYWMPLHSLFARCTKSGHRSSQVGKLLSYQHFGIMAAPLIGGVVTYFLGFEVLFFIALVLLLIPIGILLYSKEIMPHVNFKFKNGLHLLKKHRKHFFHVSGEVLGQTAESLLWPIFVFSVLVNELSVGLVGTLVGAGTIAFTLIIGKHAHKDNRKLIFKVGAFLLALVWISKYFAQSEIVIYVLSALAGFFSIMFTVPHLAETYELAKKDKHTDEFIIFRELPVAVGNISMLLLAIFLVEKIELSFLATGLNFLVMLFI